MNKVKKMPEKMVEGAVPGGSETIGGPVSDENGGTSPTVWCHDPAGSRHRTVGRPTVKPHDSVGSCGSSAGRPTVGGRGPAGSRLPMAREATVRLFCQHRAKVIIADIQDDLDRSVCASIGSDDIVAFVHCYISMEPDIKNVVAYVVSEYGKLDVMFNNAAIIEHTYPRITNFDISAFEKTMQVNCVGVFLGIKHATWVMIEGGVKGSIINNRSASTVVRGLAPHGYVASKHAMVGLTKNAAAELGQYEIRVNCVLPLLIASALAEMGIKRKGRDLEEWVGEIGNLRAGAVLTSEDTAATAIYFASDESKYVSGHNFVIHGGFTSVNNYFGLFKQQQGP